MSKHRRSSSRATNNTYPDEFVQHILAVQDGPKRKNWTKHDLKQVHPLTPTQHEMFEDFFQGFHIVAHGSAGTGKTFLACYLALSELLSTSNDYDRIVIVRSAVPTRDVGFMPGTLDEKVALYELPYKDIFEELLGKHSSYQDMKDAGKVSFCTTSYVRGLTWDNCIVIVDETQSATFHEINSVITRIGKNTRLIVAGDIPQSDLRKGNERSGMQEFIKVASKMGQFSVISFTHHDIVRSEFVKSWITTCDEVGVTL